MSPADPSPLGVVAALILGAVQGATEFLPVSSSGHLALAQAWLQIDPAAGGHLMSVVVHAGTLLAVLVVYRRDLVALARSVRVPNSERKLLIALAVGTLPLAAALIDGVRDAIIMVEGQLALVGAALLLTAVLLLLTKNRNGDAQNIPPRHALLIGLAQLAAITPGISRSGSTIAAAMYLGVQRSQAARFSFLLSIPAICGAVAIEALKLSESPVSLALPVIAAGFASSFVVGLLALRGLLGVVRKGQLWMFAPYLLVVGVAAIALSGR